MGGLLPRRRQQAQGAPVGGAAAHLPLEALHRFQVVVEAGRFGRQHGRQALALGPYGRGFVALAAARAASGGADRDTVAAEAESTVSRVHAFLVVQRLENLRRSGRIGAAASWLGTALALKPLLRIDDGKLVLAQRVRTTSKATVAMVEQVLAVVGERRAALAVHHVDNPAGAAEVAATLAGALPGCGPVIVTDLGPVLGVHLGPGAVGVVLALEPD